MKLAIQHTMLPGEGLSEKFRRAAEYGFAGVELAAWGFPGPMWEHRAEIEAAMQAGGLPVSSLCTQGSDDFVHPDPAERERRLAGLVRMLMLADDLGAQGVVALPIRPPLHLRDLSPAAGERALITRLAVAALETALAQTPGGRASIFLEPLNRYEATYLCTLEQAVALCGAVGSPRVLILADTFHMNIEEADLATSLRAAVPHVGHIHLADSNRLLPGHGHTCFAAPFCALREADFAGWLALECGIPGDPAATLPEAVAFLRTHWERAAPG